MPAPILYSFRRCPYAMRARLALAEAGITCELREIVLRDKAPEMLAASPKGTVPVLVDGISVIDESIDIMRWALAQNDPSNWNAMPPEGDALIARMDGPFKAALDRTKYAVRYPDVDVANEREKAAVILRDLDTTLAHGPYLFGAATLADYASLPFVRQFANIDRTWFDAQGWPHLCRWLDQFLASDRFARIMTKYPKWTSGDDVTLFPE